MKYFILPLLVAAAVASPTPQLQQQTPPRDAAPVEITHSENYLTPSGYHFSFSTSDGTSRQEQGQYRVAGSGPEGNHALSVQGSYAYVAPDGKQYNVAYIADENGYRLQNEQSHGQLAQTQDHSLTREQYSQTQEQLTQAQEQYPQTQEQYSHTQDQHTQTQEQLTQAHEQNPQTQEQYSHPQDQHTQTQEQLTQAHEQYPQSQEQYSQPQ